MYDNSDEETIEKQENKGIFRGGYGRVRRRCLAPSQIKIDAEQRDDQHSEEQYVVIKTVDATERTLKNRLANG